MGSVHGKVKRCFVLSYCTRMYRITRIRIDRILKFTHKHSLKLLKFFYGIHLVMINLVFYHVWGIRHCDGGLRRGLQGRGRRRCDPRRCSPPPPLSALPAAQHSAGPPCPGARRGCHEMVFPPECNLEIRHILEPTCGPLVLQVPRVPALPASSPTLCASWYRPAATSRPS